MLLKKCKPLANTENLFTPLFLFMLINVCKEVSIAIIICKYGIKHLANTNTYFVSFHCESMFLLECGKFTQEKRSMVKHGFNIEGGWRRRKTHVASSPKSSDTISLTFSSVPTNRKYVWHLLNRHTVYNS